jgi:NTP pyrophosphatase (non-canonical NTP hydrolase)
MTSDNFNKLTPAESERLAMLAEEAGEIVQMVGKILRHGYESYHPDDPNMTSNRTHLMNELNDLNGVIFGMCKYEDLDVKHFSLANAVSAWDRKIKWSHHQDKTDES